MHIGYEAVLHCVRLRLIADLSALRCKMMQERLSNFAFKHLMLFWKCVGANEKEARWVPANQHYSGRGLVYFIQLKTSGVIAE